MALVVSQKNFGGIPLLSVRFENLAAAPTAFGAGHAYFDTVLGYWRYYNGSAWKSPILRTDHVGTQTASTISDFDTQVRTSRIDQLAAAGANLAMGGFKITGAAAGTTAGDLVEYNQLITQLSLSAAGITSRPPVRAVATSNITLSGTQTIDGVALIAGDRVLVTAQTTGSANGVYIVGASAWSRASPEDTALELETGTMWLATEGTTYAGTQWRQSTPGTVTVGTTSLAIVQFSAGGGYTASLGVQLVSSDIRLKLPASSGLIADTTGVYLDPAIAVKKFAQNVGNGSLTSIVVTHNLNTRDITVGVQDATSFAGVECDWAATTVNTATFTFAAAPTTNQYRVTIHG